MKSTLHFIIKWNQGLGVSNNPRDEWALQHYVHRCHFQNVMFPIILLVNSTPPGAPLHGIFSLRAWTLTWKEKNSHGVIKEIIGWNHKIYFPNITSPFVTPVCKFFFDKVHPGMLANILEKTDVLILFSRTCWTYTIIHIHFALDRGGLTYAIPVFF